ncbi:MAG: ABC transporter permease [Bryobacteraceae bacterium]
MSREPVWRRLDRLFGEDPAADARDELSFHAEAKTAELIAQGWRPEAARAEALRQLGDVDRIIREGAVLGERRNRRQRFREFWSNRMDEVKFALRTLRKNPGFAVTAIAILALGIGANTAVFSVVNTLLLRPLPFAEPGRLVWLTADKALTAQVREAAGLSGVTYTVDAYEAYRAANQSFESVTAYNPFFGNGDFTMTGAGEPQSVLGVMVEERFFQTLGIAPIQGRLFTHAETQQGGPGAAILSYGFWRRHFGGDPAVVGRSVVLAGEAVTIAGVMPRDFDFGSVFAPGLRADLYVPVNLDRMRTWGNTLALVGRLKPGVTVGQAQAEADVLFPQLRAAHPNWWGAYESTLSPLKDHVSGQFRRALLLLWGAVGLVQLLVCVNLSGLLVARGEARNREFALRAALGAGRGRLAMQWLAEGAILVSAGALAGIGLAIALVEALRRTGSLALPLLTDIRVDAASLGWTAAVAAAAAVIFAVAPALRMPVRQIQGVIKSGGHGLSGDRSTARVRNALVIAEVTLACVLLIGSGLLLRSLYNVLDVGLGFESEGASVVKVDYPEGDRGRRTALLREALDRVSALPGVDAAGIADMLPLGRNRSWGFRAKGRTYPKELAQVARVRIVTPGYFEAMGIRLAEGRDFSWQDAEGAVVAVVNQSAARVFWGGDDPLGRDAVIGGRDARVIGIVEDVRGLSIEGAPGPEFYMLVAQAGPEGAHLVIRSALPPQALAAPVIRTLRQLNPGQPAAEPRPLASIVDNAVAPRRFFVLLICAFGTMGLILAALGLYGVISYTVARRQQEIGIRMALGAGAGRVRRDVIGRAVALALAGIALGTAAGLAGGRWIESMLFGMKPADTLTMAAAAAVLVGAAALAAYIPARRASRINPIQALRGE